MDVLARARSVAATAGGAARALARDPRHRGLRRLLLVGIALQLVLAPLTSWSPDTTVLARSAQNVVRTGNPYSSTGLSTPLLDPPLGVLLVAPLLAALSIVLPFGTMLQPVASHPPALATQGEVPTLLPVPAVLLLQKLPAVVGSSLVAVALYHVTRDSQAPRKANLVAAAWMFNPDVLWSSAVVGHFDALAALGVVAALAFLAGRRPIVAGLALGLGTAVKGYPLLLLPLLLVWWFRGCTPAPSGAPERWAGAGRILGGTAVGVLPALVYAPQLWNLYVGQRELDQQPFGGFSPWLLSSPGLAQELGLPGSSFGPPSAVVLLLPLVLMFGLTLCLAFRTPKAYRTSGSPLPILSLLSAGVVGGALLAYRAPQPENVVALLPLLLLALPALGRWGWTGFLGVSSSGTAIAVTTLTPLGMVYPAAILVGHGEVGALDRAILAYLSFGQGWNSRSGYIALEGLVGAAFLVLVCGLVALVGLRALRDPPVREAISSEPGVGTKSRTQGGRLDSGPEGVGAAARGTIDGRDASSASAARVAGGRHSSAVCVLVPLRWSMSRPRSSGVSTSKNFGSSRAGRSAWRRISATCSASSRRWNAGSIANGRPRKPSA
jgi:hypothetical protein